MLPRGIKRSFESENSPESRNLSDIDSEEVRQNQNFFGRVCYYYSRYEVSNVDPGRHPKGKSACHSKSKT